MSFTSRDWSQLFEQTKKRIQVIKSQGRQLSSIESNAINNNMSTLDTQLKTMESHLLEFEIFPSEIARRRILLTNIKNLLINGTIMNDNSSTNNPMHRDNKGNLSNHGISLQHKELINQQDDMITDLGVGLDRLSAQADTIGMETKQHGKLLQAMEQETDSTTDNLMRQTARAKEMKDKADVCWLYICAAIEFVLLLILVLVGFTVGNL